MNNCMSTSKTNRKKEYMYIRMGVHVKNVRRLSEYQWIHSIRTLLQCAIFFRFVSFFEVIV